MKIEEGKFFIINYFIIYMINLILAIPKCITKQCSEIKLTIPRLETLEKDVFQLSKSAEKKVVKVYQDTTIPRGNFTLTSPEFNGCHGIGIVGDKDVFFTHFPPFMQQRICKSLEKGLSNMKSSSENAKIIFVAPVNSKSEIPEEFSKYVEMIKSKFHNCQIEFLVYPQRSKNATYCFNLEDKCKRTLSLIICNRQFDYHDHLL